MTTEPEQPTEEFHEADQLRLWLRHKDEPCPVCGYNLRHQTTDRCSECGSQFQLGIKSVDQRFGYFVVFAAPMIGGAAISALFWMALGRFAPAPIPLAVWALLIAGPVDAIIAVVAFRKRVSYMTTSNAKQLGLIACSWIVHLIGMAVFISYS